MAQAQINPDVEERPYFPHHGARCPVSNCQADTFTNYAKFSRHWNRAHMPFRSILRCLQCGYLSERNYDARRHSSRCGASHLSTQVQVVNAHYRSPGGAIKYKLAPPEVRLQHQLEEEQQRERARRQEIEEREQQRERARRQEIEEREQRKRNAHEERKRKAHESLLDLTNFRKELLDYEDELNEWDEQQANDFEIN